MGRHIAAIIAIFVAVSVAWIVLGNTVMVRTHSQDQVLKGEVGQLWGTAQAQKAPLVSLTTTTEKEVSRTVAGKPVVEKQTEKLSKPLAISGSDIDADLKLDYRQKGLLWYSTYHVGFKGQYRVTNTTPDPGEASIAFEFPNSGAIYDDFTFLIDGKEAKDLRIEAGRATATVGLLPGQTMAFVIGYKSQGMDEWWYDFGENVSQIRDFTLTMQTDFKDINFPQNSISPTGKTESGAGWKLVWDYSNLLTGVKIGMEMPHKLNPGPWVANVSYFAPISLLFFLFVLFIITVIRRIQIHPMNYLFVAAAYFSFHLLLAYLADHISIHLAFLICSVVSILLVVSYMRLVVGKRFALIEVGLSQFVFLVLFSYTFFFQGYTGLAVTVLAIATLFVVMQMTGRVDWEEVFRQSGTEPISKS